MVLDNLCSNSGTQLYSMAFVENSGQDGLCVLVCNFQDFFLPLKNTKSSKYLNKGVDRFLKSAFIYSFGFFFSVFTVKHCLKVVFPESLSLWLYPYVTLPTLK